MATLSSRAEAKLRLRTPLTLDPTAPMAIKRTMHALDIDTDADAFAAALRTVLRGPNVELGAIDIKRKEDGVDFIVGERFHGCIRLHRLGHPWLSVLGHTRLGAWLEDALLSDYAEVVESSPCRVVCHYLSGTPMAGTSTFEIRPLSPQTCRFQVTFEYQEIGGLAVEVLHRFGLRLHDRVTAIQADRAAKLAGASVIRSTIPYL